MDPAPGTGVGVCSVVGFPLGATTSDVKHFETRRAIFDGACEIDEHFRTAPLADNLPVILAVLGVTAMLTPVTVPESILRYDMWIMLAAAIAVHSARADVYDSRR